MSNENDTTAVPYTLTNESVSVVWDGKAHTVQKGTPQFNGLRKALIDALATNDWSGVGFHLTMEGALQQWLGDKFVVGEDQFTARDGTRRRHILYQGIKVPEQIVERIWRMASNNESPAGLFRFWERLQKNPSKRSVDSLYNFLQHEGIPIEEDGTFLAYKGVRNDLKDCHTGTVDNSPGQVHEMARNLVSDDPRTACHYGFHVGAKRYANGHGPVTVICRVDPEHVVCVPYDSSAEKMRVCKYEVVGFSSGETMSSTTATDDTKVTDDKFAPPSNDRPEDEFKDLDRESGISFSEFVGRLRNTIDPGAVRPDRTDEAFMRDAGIDWRHMKSAWVVNVTPEAYFKHMSTRQNAEDDVYGHNILDENPSSFIDDDEAKPIRETKPTVVDAAYFSRLKMRGLMEESIDDLRKYASQTLKIVGASKLKGGKAKLVAKILQARKTRRRK